VLRAPPHIRKVHYPIHRGNRPESHHLKGTVPSAENPTRLGRLVSLGRRIPPVFPDLARPLKIFGAFAVQFTMSQYERQPDHEQRRRHHIKVSRHVHAARTAHLPVPWPFPARSILSFGGKFRLPANARRAVRESAYSTGISVDIPKSVLFFVLQKFNSLVERPTCG